MRKHFLLLMLMALLPMVGFAGELLNSTQYGEDGLMYVIKSMKEVDGKWTGTVSVRQNNWMTNPKVTNKAALTISPTVAIPVQGTYSGSDVNAIVTFDVVEIETGAFKGLESITSVTFSDGCKVTKIGSEAFSGTSIEKLDLTKTKITVLNKLFEDNNIALKKVIMPATLQELAVNALANCVQLGVDLEGGEKGGVDFSLCKMLTTLNAGSLSNTVVSVYDFSNCCVEELDDEGKHKKYTSFLNFDDGDPFVNGTTKTNKNLQKVILPYGKFEKKSPVNVIGTVFANCEALTEIQYLNVSKITAIDNGAFANDIALSSLTFPGTLKTVSGAPFNGCKTLETLTFDGTSLTNLGSGAAAAVNYTADEANAFNATLDGAIHAGEVKTEATHYTQDEADEYNRGLTDALDYTAAEFDATSSVSYNTAIKPVTDVIAGDAITDEHKAAMKAYNATLTGSKAAGDQKTAAVLYTADEANTENAKLPGAVSTSTVKTPALNGNLFGDFTHVIAWGDPNTTEEFNSPLKNLYITVGNSALSKVTITAKAFTGTKVEQNGLIKVEIAKAGTFAGTIEENAITLAANKNSEVTFGNIGDASNKPTFNSIIGPVGTFTSTLTIGNYKQATLTTAPIVSNVISLATVKGKVSQADVLNAIGQAQSIDFQNNITVALSVPSKPNAVLTTLNFNSIELIEAPKDGTVPGGPAIVEATFNETNAPLLTDVTWNPKADVAEDESTPLVTEKRIYNYAAFEKNAFGSKEMKEKAKVTLHTTSAIADGFYHMLEANLFNVIFDAKALLPEPVEITVLGTESAGFYYGKLVADKANMAIANRTEDGDQVVVYSAFVDGKRQEIYMDALAQKDDNFIVEKGQVVIVRVKQPTTTEDNMLKGVATGKKSAVMAYATEEFNTMRSVYNADKKAYEILNDLKVNDILFSSDYIGTNFVGKQLYAMDNPAVMGKLHWSPVGAKSILPPNSVYVITEPTTSSSASELNIIWLDGTEDFTGIIEKLNSDKAGVNNDVIYNLQGVRVSNMSQKGVYIKNGKKFIVK